MIEADRPACGGGHRREDPRGQIAPAGEQPLILTLAIRREDQAFFDRLRLAHFPPERNVLPAHVTLFHHLPGHEHSAVAADAVEAAQATLPFDVAVTGLRPLGSGVAFTLASAQLDALRAGLAARWEPWLTRQDRQRFRPHVTVQNKVTPEDARALRARLGAGFAPFTTAATGLLLWRYCGGPWEPAGAYSFAKRDATARSGTASGAR